MARYQRPPDPREAPTELITPRTRRQRGDARPPIPWLWLAMGVVVTLVAIVAALFVANALLARAPLATNLPTPTIIRLTAPPSPTPSATPPLATPTLIPTFTPAPTPDLAVPPAAVTVGYYAQVANTEGVGVIVRGGPSTDNVRILLASEGTLMLVTGGPAEGSDLTWWQVRLDDGTEGWVAADFLIPAAAP
ncbi:MAG: SH3 domain-containing protein [Chloroflexota bacterium]